MLQSMGLQRIGHNLVTEQQQQHVLLHDLSHFWLTEVQKMLGKLWEPCVEEGKTAALLGYYVSKL